MIAISKKRSAKPPTFETVYRRARANHKDRDLYFTFCKRIAAFWGIEFGRLQHGHAVWVWERNECATEKATTKALCWGEFHRFDGMDWRGIAASKTEHKTSARRPREV